MGEETSRYDAVAVALHWLIGVALLAQISFGFLLDEIAPRGTPISQCSATATAS